MDEELPFIFFKNFKMTQIPRSIQNSVNGRESYLRRRNALKKLTKETYRKFLNRFHGDFEFAGFPVPTLDSLKQNSTH